MLPRKRPHNDPHQGVRRIPPALPPLANLRAVFSTIPPLATFPPSPARTTGFPDDTPRRPCVQTMTSATAFLPIFWGARFSAVCGDRPLEKTPAKCLQRMPGLRILLSSNRTRPITRWIRRRTGDRSTASAASSLGEWPAWRQNSPPLDSLIDPLAADRLRVTATTGPFSPGYRSLGEAPCVSARSPFTPITKRPCATGMYWQEKPP